jgi:S23 ribosomal protein.
MIQSYKDLKVYEKSYGVALKVYRRVSEYPREERYGLISQMKRAATSIPLNIAEGYGKRKSGNEFKRYLMMSIGSCDEMRVLIDFSKDLGYLTVEEWEEYEKEYVEIGKMLSGLHARWE